jgi:hypothetical protein
MSTAITYKKSEVQSVTDAWMKEDPHAERRASEFTVSHRQSR